MPFIIDARNMGGGSIGSAAGGDTSTGTRNNVTLAAPWDENKEYLKGDLATNNGDLYQAQKSVPAGVQISDEDYWALVVAGDKSKETEQLRKDIGSLAELETESKDNLVNAINEVGSIQPDWNQNDETKKDYIKNRTHWVEEKTILEETTFTIEESADSFAFGNFPVTLSAGDICNVMYDGEAYTGTLDVWEDSASIDLGEFSVYFQNQLDGLCAITIYSYPGEHTISILQKVYHPIPDEYIPNWVASIDNIMQPDWNQNDETKKDYIKHRPGGYIEEITEPILEIWATKQDGINKLTDVQVFEDNFMDKSSINVAIDNGFEIIHRTLTNRFIPGYVINEYGATVYGNAHLIAASQPDTGEDLAMYKDDFGESAYGIGWHIWATSIPSGDLQLVVLEETMHAVPFASKFIPWKESPTADSVLYTAQSLTDGQQAQARANIGAGTPYTLPQATAEALGGVKADSAEAADTQPVRIGTDGKLYTAPGLTDISTKMDANNPVGTGSFSMNRKAHTVIGINSHAEGSSTTASGRSSHAEGNSTTASGDYSHAEGFSTTANVVSSHAEGSSTTASGGSSHAEGNRTTASGGNSHAEGVQTTASGDHSHTEGANTTASGLCSHAEGNITTASGTGSHVEGGSTKASGDYSHAEGIGTEASGSYSHAEGRRTKASGDNSHAQGKFNIEDTSSIYADIIGNGTSDTARSNAATVDWSGNAWFAGDVYTGSTSGTNKDDGSKKLATEEYVNNSIAAGGTDISLGLTSAAVGQIIKVKAIDESGKPTAWEAAEEKKWIEICDVPLTEDFTPVAEFSVTALPDGTPLEGMGLKEICFAGAMQIAAASSYSYGTFFVNDKSLLIGQNFSVNTAGLSWFRGKFELLGDSYASSEWGFNPAASSNMMGGGININPHFYGANNPNIANVYTDTEIKSIKITAPKATDGTMDNMSKLRLVVFGR